MGRSMSGSSSSFADSRHASRRLLAWAFIAALGALVGCGGSTSVAPVMVTNQRPTIFLTTEPLQGDSVSYNVRFTWFAFDADGRVTSFEYAIDPPSTPDTVWVRTTAGGVTIPFPAVDPSPGPPPIGHSYHVFIIRAIDNEGARSRPELDAFTAYTVAPKTQILSPSPSRLAADITPSTVTIRWRGDDPDGANGHVPVRFKYRVVSRSQVQNDLGLGSIVPSASDLQGYFSKDAPGFATWDSVPPESSFARYETLPVGQIHYFAVVAFDDAGAYEPIFDLDRNVLQFKPSTEVIGPRLTVSNEYFSYTQLKTTSDVSDARLVHVPALAGEPVRFDWEAIPAPGTAIASYRWVLDPVNGDLTDQTPRQSDDQTYRWSNWSVAEKVALLGPFNAAPELDQFHFLYIEARDDAGNWTRVGIEITVVARSRPILVVDDFQATPDRAFAAGDPRNYQPYGNFPTEAVLDTLFFAVGNVPYRYRPPGTVSPPGMFAGFDYDTLDYRFIGQRLGVPLELMLRYKAVVWFTSTSDAFRVPPSQSLCALRYACTPGNVNVLAAYVRHGGDLWLFGNGVCQSISLGETGKIVNSPQEGSFLFDILKVRSRIDRSGTDPFGADVSTQSVPYLPDNATPGRPWPPDTTHSVVRGSCDDPRVGPTASRVLTRWAGLPCLTLTTEFPSWPSGFPPGFSCFYVSLPLSIPGDPTTKTNGVIESALDTLYLYRAKTYNPSAKYTNTDGKPVMFSYRGADHGPVVWSDLPLWVIDRTELRQLAASVLRRFGFAPQPNPALWTGPGSANAILNAMTQEKNASVATSRR